jgi:hypothetical protein
MHCPARTAPWKTSAPTPLPTFPVERPLNLCPIQETCRTFSISIFTYFSTRLLTGRKGKFTGHFWFLVVLWVNPMRHEVICHRIKPKIALNRSTKNCTPQELTRIKKLKNAASTGAALMLPPPRREAVGVCRFGRESDSIDRPLSVA